MTILIARIQDHQVEVLNVWTTGDGRKVASVKALRGEPFISWTHGGYAYSASATVRADLLHDFVITPELDECGCSDGQTCSLCRIPMPRPADVEVQ